MSKEIIPASRVAQSIHLLRGQKVMLDFDLAVLYGVTTKTLNQAVKRNRVRFPEDFMFQLSAEKSSNLRSQIMISRAQIIDSQRYSRYRSQIVTGTFKPSSKPRREIGFHVREKAPPYRARKKR
jgi:hypothetical protein